VLTPSRIFKSVQAGLSKEAFAFTITSKGASGNRYLNGCSDRAAGRLAQTRSDQTASFGLYATDRHDGRTSRKAAGGRRALFSCGAGQIAAVQSRLPMALDFSALNRYARREYKFAQSSSFNMVNPAVMGANYQDSLTAGVCMGAVLNWIKEKMSTSNGLLRRDGPLMNSTAKHFSSPINPVTRLKQGMSPPAGSPLTQFMQKNQSGPRNRSTVLSAAMTQVAYSTTSRDHIARELGLIDVHETLLPVQRPDPQGMPIRIEDETIARAARELPRGRALLIEIEHRDIGHTIEHEDVGHTIGFYHSRGNTLHFFDPNAGVYALHNCNEDTVLEFVRAWLGVYVRNAQWNFKTSPRDWYAMYARSD
jgi:hypothetical protein